MKDTKGYRDERRTAKDEHRELANRLKEVFHQRGWSFAEPAVQMGVPFGTFTQWMQGGLPNAANRVKLAAFADELLGVTAVTADRTDAANSENTDAVVTAVVRRLADAIGAWRAVGKQVAAMGRDVQTIRELFTSGKARVSVTEGSAVSDTVRERALAGSSAKNALVAEPFLTVPEAARKVRANSITIRRAYAAGHLHIERVGRRVLTTESALRAWRAAGGRTDTQSPPKTAIAPLIDANAARRLGNSL